MDELINELKRLAEDLDSFAVTDRGHAAAELRRYPYYAERCRGKADAFELSADWVREIVERHASETL